MLDLKRLLKSKKSKRYTLADKLYDLQLADRSRRVRENHPNVLARHGKKCFSQTDEDGITLEILRRLGLETGVYAEFGVGNGTENNTLILAALGWRGFWVGGEDLVFETTPAMVARFDYQKAWIDRDNIVELARIGLQRLGATKVDVVSLDLDGNDYHFIAALLADDIRPKLFIAEYNAVFPPPVEFVMPYDREHRWVGDSYFGASLQALAKLFNRYGYRLVCCNSHSGGNAFFIEDSSAEAFRDVSERIDDLYVAPRYFLYRRYGHPVSAKVIRAIMEGAAATPSL